MRTTVHIQNLKCGGCANTIKNKLIALEDVTDIEVNLEDESVSFEHPSHHDFERVKHVLESLGYPILGAENKFTTRAKSYISCAAGRMKNSK